LSFVPLEQSLPAERDWSRRSVALPDLFIPEWWGKANGARPRPAPELLGHLAGIEFVTGFDSPAPLSDTLQVRRLELVGTTWAPLGLALLASSSLSLLLTAGLRRRRKPVPRPAVIAAVMRDVQLESHETMDRRRLLEWLGDHYMDEDLSLDKAARAAGIHPRRISGLLREAGGSTFPGYVNALRLAQAQRLLRETDRTVAEISIAVGIANIQRFHRLFKSATGRTPLEWRSQEDQRDTEGANAN
jgi:AraC-like DNA-binding protein